MMQVSRDVGRGDLASSGHVLVSRVQRHGLELRVVQVLSVTEDSGSLVSLLTHRQHVTGLVNGPHHPGQCLLLPQQGVVLRYQHVDRDPVDIKPVKEVLDGVSHPLGAVDGLHLEYGCGHLRYLDSDAT